MSHYYWNDWYMGWGWFLWFGIFLLFFSSIGNWGYTYRAHRKYESGYPNREALDILNERYARGEIKHEEYIKMKFHILHEASAGLKEDGRLKSERNPSNTYPPTASGQ